MVRAATLLLALFTVAPKEEPAPPERARTVAGKVGEVRLAEGSLSLDLRDGSLVLRVDRNTAVFLPARQGTLRDLTSGEPVRVSLAPSGLANWIEVHPRGIVPTPRTGELAPPPPPTAPEPEPDRSAR